MENVSATIQLDMNNLFLSLTIIIIVFKLLYDYDTNKYIYQRHSEKNI
jgi:hypothetical protein